MYQIWLPSRLFLDFDRSDLFCCPVLSQHTFSIPCRYKLVYKSFWEHHISHRNMNLNICGYTKLMVILSVDPGIIIFPLDDMINFHTPNKMAQEQTHPQKCDSLTTSLGIGRIPDTATFEKRQCESHVKTRRSVYFFPSNPIIQMIHRRLPVSYFSMLRGGVLF